MASPSRYVLVAAFLSVAACGGSVKWRPWMVTQVPDGTEVRYRERSNASTARIGRALGWSSETPRMVTARGDTVVIPTGAQLEVRVNNPDRHTNFGAVVGYVAGIFAALSTCGPESYCGEDNPAPLLGAIVGALVGHFITDDWVSVTH